MNRKAIRNTFERSGLASLDDLESESWKAIFSLLEKGQQEFLSAGDAIWSAEYRKKWPTDALHWWSRVWEYPYVYYHLAAWRSRISDPGIPVVVDLGSGVNFFPFSVARLGCDVKCVDVDETCYADLQKAIKKIRVTEGKVEAFLCHGARLPFGDNAVDAIYCISVLEHVLDFQTTILEAFRILKPGGLFLLTIDLDLCGNAEIGPERHETLVSALTDRFSYVYGDTTIHPTRILRSNTGPSPLKNLQGFPRFWFFIRQRVLKPLLGMKALPMPENLYLAVQGFALTKKE